MTQEAAVAGTQGIGWFSIRVADLDSAHHFFEAVGFGEVLGKTDRYGHFEVGEGTWLNVGQRSESAPQPRVVAPSGAGTLPVFASRDTVECGRRAEQITGHAPVELETPFGTAVCVTDVEDNWIAFVPDAADAESGKNLVHRLAGVVRRVSDLARSAPFYSALGLEFAATTTEAVSADIGNQTRFALVQADQPFSTPGELASRSQAPMCPILRVYQLDRFAARARTIDSSLFEQVRIGGGELFYVTDPDRHILGFQERSTDSVRPVDALMRARWNQLGV